MNPVLLQEAVARAREVATRVLREHVEEVDREALWPEAGMRALQDAGLGGLVVPEHRGGLGHGTHALARVCEELGAEDGSTAISFGMHLVGAAVIAADPGEAQKTRLLDPIVRGRHLTTLALSEPGTGVHLYLPQTRIVHGENSFTVTGTKSFVTNGGHADSYVISGVSEDSPDPAEFSCFVVEKDRPGVRWGEPWAGWGMRGNSACTMSLDRVELPAENLLGREGDQIWYLFRIMLPYFMAAMSGTYLGIARAAVEEARAHLGARRHAHTGQALGRNPVLQHKFGTLWASVARTRALVYEATRKIDDAAPDALEWICSAKAEVADCAERAASEAMSLLGGRGYAVDTAVQRMYRDARAAHIMAPTTEMLRAWTARAVLDLPILGE